jgi:hypothetical protein
MNPALPSPNSTVHNCNANRSEQDSLMSSCFTVIVSAFELSQANGLSPRAPFLPPSTSFLLCFFFHHHHHHHRCRCRCRLRCCLCVRVHSCACSLSLVNYGSRSAAANCWQRPYQQRDHHCSQSKPPPESNDQKKVGSSHSFPCRVKIRKSNRLKNKAKWHPDHKLDRAGNIELTFSLEPAPLII